MDTKKTEECNSGTIYYGVYIPNEDNIPKVFEDKLEALKVVKKNKKSRFKAFQFYHEAVDFAQNGSECPNNNTTINGPLVQKPASESTQIGEKASPFKGPKPQELVELRKAIETGNYKFVKETVWQNPRYLVSSGDTPSILQEGPRYNALHVAARCKNAEITELILSTISNTDFIKLLYGDDNQENAEDRTTILLDLYLNTPNKGLNETPLHFASKHGAADVVEILVSYPQCDKTLRNKFYKTAEQIICERADGEDLTTIKRKIELLLKDSYYVPVLRAEDKSIPPLIGDPFSPTSPPVLNKDPLSPRLEIHAYAGPMDKKNAQEFRKIWKTPPRSLNFTCNKRKEYDLNKVTSLRFKDPNKGLERIGKKLAHKYNVTWKEYWHFLGNFIDITSEEGLQLLEAYLTNRYDTLNISFSKETKKVSSILNSSNPLSPISDLCVAFSSCHLNDSRSSPTHFDKKNDIESIVYIEKACQVFANRISNDILYILCSQENILQTLETEIKQLELLITSYMDDNRFSNVNFQKIHSRLGTLVGQKLYNNIKEEVRVFICNKIESLLDILTKSVDCFSSDDESHNFKDVSDYLKPTMYKKQLICLMNYIINVLSQNYETKRFGNEDDCVKYWDNAEACTCVYHLRKNKKSAISRSGSFKMNSRIIKPEFESISKKLFLDESDGDQNLIIPVRNGINLSKNHHQLDVSSEEDDYVNEQEQFYTPPSSPSLLEDLDSDCDDEFSDTESPKSDVFIEGNFPTKIDCDVFNALNYSEIKLDCNRYPNIYRWQHTVNLYTEADRESWPNLKCDQKAKLDSPNVSLHSPISMDSPKSSTPSKSWLRITGANSPKALLKTNSIH